MRDAFGGVFMIRLLLVFIFIYIAFTAVSLNYAKAFRIKNKVIDLIEQNQVTDLNKYFSAGDGENLQALEKILKEANYNKICKNGNGKVNNGFLKKKGYCHNGILIQPDREEGNTQYYKVYTYADWNLGALNMLLRFGGNNTNNQVNGSWEIVGEAKVIKK